MKIKEPESMEEIHAIRRKMYDETKDMTIHETMMYIKESAESFKARHNVKTKQIKKQIDKAGNE
jgi:protein-disulfide isomerase-like protein with CxxC motif